MTYSGAGAGGQKGDYAIARCGIIDGNCYKKALD